MATPALELLQFPYSHYNEKARWALDYKRIPHRRTSLLPGPHALTIRRMTGQTQVPVVRFDDAVLHGSARILDELERRWPEPPLLPADPAARRRALELERWFDEEVGPRVRRALFATLLQEPDYVTATFAGHRSAPVRRLYRAAFPLVRVPMKQSMGITGDDAVQEALEGTRQALDLVAKEAGPSGYLVGDGFTVADLTAAALLAPAVMPEGSPMSLPEPRPESVRLWLARWASHPGADWVRTQYARHRPPSAEVPEAG